MNVLVVTLGPWLSRPVPAHAELIPVAVTTIARAAERRNFDIGLPSTVGRRERKAPADRDNGTVDRRRRGLL